MAVMETTDADIKLSVDMNSYTISRDYSVLSDAPTVPSIVLVVEERALPLELRDGMSEFIRFAPHKNIVSENAMNTEDGNEYKWNIKFMCDGDLRSGQLVVSSNYPNFKSIPPSDRFEVTVRYRRRIEAFRGLGRILGAARRPDYIDNIKELLNFVEQAQFDSLGLMVDCSRNGVLKVQSVFYLLRNMALMGINMLQLYTEDTYEVEGEPFFGYLRGRYTIKELSAIDEYADDLGIEVIPCIQALGHMGQVLQWPKYAHLRDTSEVLLAESEETYEFLEKIIKAATEPFRTDRIHIGMDEAHGVGEGRYRQIFGHKDSTQVFVEHLRRVNEICVRLGKRPLIWSDMLFCLAAKNNSLSGYYDPGPDMSQVAENLPYDVDLVFWSYYHTVPEVYSRKIRQHRELGCANPPWIATGLWAWSRFWTALPFTFESVRACMQAAKDPDDSVRNVFITIWGDEGNECDIYSSLPGLLYFAQHGYTSQDEVDILLLKQNFDGICGGNFDDFVYASKLDDVNAEPAVSSKTQFTPNISKWLLWEDPFFSFMSPQYAAHDLETHYATIRTNLLKALTHKDGWPLNDRLELATRLATVLSLKCHLRERLVEAYRSGDRVRLLALAQDRIEPLRREVDALWRYHRGIWMAMYKPFGWEVLELRYGGLRTRLETMYDRIVEYANGQDGISGNGDGTAKESEMDPDMYGGGIPELEVELQTVYEHAGTNLMLDYGRVSAVSRLG